MRAALLATFVLTACELPTVDGDFGDTSSTVSGCPAGLVQGTGGALQAQTFTVDAFPSSITYASTATYDGQPAACISEDGTQVELVLLLNQEPAGVLTVIADETGPTTLGEGGGAGLRLVFEDDSGETFTLGESSWTGGLLSINQVGEQLRFSLSNGTAATSDGTRISLSASGGANVP